MTEWQNDGMTEWQNEGMTDRTKTICPPIFDLGGIKKWNSCDACFCTHFCEFMCIQAILLDVDLYC